MKNFSIILGAIILVLFVTLVIWGVYCDNTIAITNYCVNNTKNDAKLKFVVITDLHNKEYGEKNADLAELVKEQNPDFIAVCGDMVNRGDPDTTKMKDVLEKLSKIAPTYCCLGNHERDNAAKFGTDFKSETNSTGAVLLDNEYIKFTKNGKSVLIGGMSDYPYYEFYTPDDDVPSRTLWEEQFHNSSAPPARIHCRGRKENRHRLNRLRSHPRRTDSIAIHRRSNRSESGTFSEI